MKKILCILFVSLLLLTSCSKGIVTIKGDDSIYISDKVLTTVQYTFAFRASDKTLAYNIDKAMYEMKEDGTAGKISAAWLGEDKMLKSEPMAQPEVDDGSLKLLLEGPKDAEEPPEKILKVGYINSYYPFSWRDAYKTVVGLDVDLITEAARRVGLGVEFTAVDPDTRAGMLASGKVDALISAFEYSEDYGDYSIEKADDFTMISPYIETGLVVMSAVKNSFEDMSGLRRKKLILPKTSAASKKYAKECGEVYDKTSEAQSCSHGYYRVKERRYDGMIVDQIFAYYVSTGRLNV